MRRNLFNDVAARGRRRISADLQWHRRAAPNPASIAAILKRLQVADAVRKRASAVRVGIPDG
jgi:hypothetical protein